MLTNERDGYWHLSAFKGSWHNYSVKYEEMAALSIKGAFFILRKAGTSVLCSQIHPVRPESELEQANTSRHNRAVSEQEPQPSPQPPAAKPDKMLGRRPAGRSRQLDATAGRGKKN